MGHRYIGQWVGEMKDGSFALLNMNEAQDGVKGRVSLSEKFENELYWLWGVFEVSKLKGDIIKGTVKGLSVHSYDGEILSDEDLEAKILPFTELPSEVEVVGYLDKNTSISLKTKIVYPSGSKLKSFTLKRESRVKSLVKHSVKSWDEFREEVYKQDGMIYRGQSSDWRLRTGFHRTGRADIIEFLDVQVPELENYVGAISEHNYDLGNDRDIGALLNLAQHHGYPTPLLDWTRSPYIAAFFAFEDESRLHSDEAISIFVFDDEKWSKNVGRYAPMRVPQIVVRTLELPSFGNPRSLPQQSVIMYTNIDDIETEIKYHESGYDKYLTAYSIPASERGKAMRDLRLMGITWGSLFPGVDGTCKQLKDKHFPKLG